MIFFKKGAEGRKFEIFGEILENPPPPPEQIRN
jgi:hypothetical protein